MEDFILPVKKPIFESDYKYVTDADLLRITVTQLAKLEADLHSLRIIFVANDNNPDTMISNNTTISQEMEKISKTIKNIEEYFSEILADEN